MRHSWKHPGLEYGKGGRGPAAGNRTAGHTGQLWRESCSDGPRARQRRRCWSWTSRQGNNPGDAFQRGVYSVAVEDRCGGRARGWRLLDGSVGKADVPFDLSGWTRETVAAKFRELEDNIEAGRFDPDPEPDKCNFCSVSYACRFAV